jgi:hypothetical protein
VTDLGALRLEGERLRPAFRHAGVAEDDVRRECGFALEGRLPEAEAVTPEERRVLEALDPEGIRLTWV